MRNRALLCGIALIATAEPASAQSRTEITPHIEASQVLTADLQSGDVLTYSTLGAGLDALIQSRRVQVQLSYNYEHRFAYDDDLSDEDVHSGLARAAIDVAPGVSFDASAIATRSRTDIRGADPSLLAVDSDNITQIYSADLGPTVSTGIGPVQIGAAYRFGYTKAETPDYVAAADQPAQDYFDSSTRHAFSASAGVEAGRVLPVGITVSAAVNREDASQLDQRYQGEYVRGDLVLPVSRELALVGGAGYEHIEISQRDALTDDDGDPVISSSGRYVTDPDSPRRIAYETDNPLFWDAGILWRPSPRTELEARIGRRYDSWSYTGSFSHQIGPGSGIQVGVYDSVQSFGRQLGSAVEALPTQFDTSPDTFSNNYNGCVYGSVGSAAGGCLNGVLQSLAAANYRARGVDGVISFNRGGTRFGIGAGYANRRYYAPELIAGIDIDGVTDESYYFQAFAARALSSTSTLSGNIYANYYESGLGSSSVWGAGANLAYTRSFGRLGASLSGGLFTYDTEGAQQDISAQALLGLGYSF
ncbi:hypothetical protein KY084_01370 [Stakelama sp. CBK3Z-3]|uniref:Preprotein translocase subunit YajC n=1 Tax=Stakelama flava TaxID=2860338 RepID=A0ABS6XH40_9SPHN|nr:hypothetical protein [Stakelama flava]MBW4329527.1 hypothetical protein [Stakelama flava]